MSTTGTRPDGRDDAHSLSTIDQLRRRVYASGASEADRDRYRRAIADRDAARDGSAPRPEAPLPTAVPVSEPVPVPVPVAAPLPVRARRDRRRRPVIVGAVVLVLVTAVGLIALQHISAPQPDTDEAASTKLSVSPAERSELLQNLADGKVAGFGAYLLTHRSLPALRTATGFLTTEWRGTGPRTIATAAASGPHARFTVLLVLATGGHGSWTAVRTTRDSEGRMRLVTLARRGGDQQAGVPTTATVGTSLSGGPDRIRIDVPPGVRWGAAMVVSD